MEKESGKGKEKRGKQKELSGTEGKKKGLESYEYTINDPERKLIHKEVLSGAK